METSKVIVMWQKLRNCYHGLWADVPIYPLVTWRILFGILLFFSTARFIGLGWIEDHYIDPVFHFKYFGFDWVRPCGITAMYIIHLIMMIAALMVALGWYYRIAMALLFVLFTYTELIDLTYYLNHYVFVSYMALIMCVLPAHRYMSIDVQQGRVASTSQIALIQILPVWLMVAIVYIFAGMAKVTHHWLLEAMPLKIWLPAHDKLPVIGGWLSEEWVAYLFSWFGMLYDLTIVFFLMWNKTRWWAFGSVVVFHALTGLLFQIGVFPIVMIAAATTFFGNAWHQRLLNRISEIARFKVSNVRNMGMNYPGKYKVFWTSLFLLFFAFQLLFPWRHLMYKGDLYWTEEGYRFGWRVMLVEKAGTATFYVKDGANGREGMVINKDFLNPHQEKQMSFQPDMILQYAHYLADHFRNNGMNDPQVRAEVYVTLNGAPSRLLIDPNIDLTKVKDGWHHKSWILE